MAAALIAKAILGSIGGALNGAAENASKNKVDGSKNISIDNTAGNTFQKAGEDIGKAIKEAKEKSSDEAKEKSSNEAKEKSSNVLSDENLKSIYGNDISDEIIKAFSKIDAADFTYKPDIQEKYADNPNMDNKEHIGVIAQQLEENPITAGTVERNENGDLEVKTGALTTENTAAIAELSRRILALEKIIMESKQ